jgi:CRP/FNR family transcriptional regulator, cyclic AMP receptor protein
MGILQPITTEKHILVHKAGVPMTPPKFSKKCTECNHRTLRPFCNLGLDALEELDNIGTQVILPDRAIAFKEGEPAKKVFIVCEGQLKLSTTSRDGRVMILRLVGTGNVLGLSAVLNNTPCEVTAETLGPVTLKSIGRDSFLAFLKKHGEVAEKTFHVLAEKYHDVFLGARRLALSGSASGRIARLLLDLAGTGAASKPEVRFNMALTHEELANMAGTSRETVSRLLKRFEHDGLIIRHGVSILICNPNRLDMIAG